MTVVDQPRKQHDLIFDVGMHQGEDTDFYLQKGFRVVGFEADPDLAAHCRNRFEKEIQSSRLTIVEGAIVDPASANAGRPTITFFKNKDNTVWGTVAPDWARRNESFGTSNETIEVPVVDFSQCLKAHGIPHYVKIDIEGMDTVCLQALLDFELKPDYVSIESEKVSLDKLVQELQLLSQLGYTRFQAVQQRGISKQVEPNPPREGRYVGYRFEEGSSGLFGGDLPRAWKNQDQIRRQYRRIFLGYRIFGDNAMLQNFFLGRFFIRGLQKLLRTPLPGWYDTHAKHSSGES